MTHQFLIVKPWQSTPFGILSARDCTHTKKKMRKNIADEVLTTSRDRSPFNYTKVNAAAGHTSPMELEEADYVDNLSNQEVVATGISGTDVVFMAAGKQCGLGLYGQPKL